MTKWGISPKITQAYITVAPQWLEAGEAVLVEKIGEEDPPQSRL